MPESSTREKTVSTTHPLANHRCTISPYSHGHRGATATEPLGSQVYLRLRYPEAIPLRSIDAASVAEELVKVMARVGVPEEILTDQGSNFTSQLLAEVYRLLKIRPIRTTPYHPQTDGLVECFNQTLKAMLRRAVSAEGRDWDKLIPYLWFVYQEVPQTSTGFASFELLYGR